MPRLVTVVIIMALPWVLEAKQLCAVLPGRTLVCKLDVQKETVLTVHDRR